MLANSLDPINKPGRSDTFATNDDNVATFIMSNTTEYHNTLGQMSFGSIAAVATNAPRNIIVKSKSPRRQTKMIDTLKAFADTGATAIFVMEDVPVNNKRRAIKPLTINLPDGTRVKSTHECNITIPGLPQILTGHIVPQLKIASLIGIRVLCEAGCKVTFDKDYCDVIYDGKIILR